MNQHQTPHLHHGRMARRLRGHGGGRETLYSEAVVDSRLQVVEQMARKGQSSGGPGRKGTGEVWTTARRMLEEEGVLQPTQTRAQTQTPTHDQGHCRHVHRHARRLTPRLRALRGCAVREAGGAYRHRVRQHWAKGECVRRLPPLVSLSQSS